MDIKNPKILSHRFLRDMYVSSYYPEFLVEKVEGILRRLCERIEQEQPKSLDALYGLTHVATREINCLQSEFLANDSEIETIARDTIGRDFDFVAQAYGFDADCERLISPRDW